MADPPPDTDSKGDTGVGPNRGSTTATPRWVKVFGVIALVAVLLFVLLLFTKGPHRPGLHASFGGLGGNTPPFSVTEVHTPSGAGLGGLTPSKGGRG